MSSKKFVKVFVIIAVGFYSYHLFAANDNCSGQEDYIGHKGYFYTEIGSDYADTGYGDFYGSLTGDAIDAENVNGRLVYMGGCWL